MSMWSCCTHGIFTGRTSEIIHVCITLMGTLGMLPNGGSNLSDV